MKKIVPFAPLISIFLLLLLPASTILAQAKRYKVYDDYIETYNDIATKNLVKYKIPASIILAQGLLESGGGKSELTISSNNHFGIKCHTDWKGEKTYRQDDGPNDCFRKYAKAEDSFADHSLFITSKKRYSALFFLEITDYKAWARGLQQSGYATDKAYANKLIKIIEDYQLYIYDTKDLRQVSIKEESKEIRKTKYKHTPYKTHDMVYVIAEQGDSYEAIAAEFDFKARDLYSYNEAREGFPLQAGDYVYFKRKKPRADKPYYEHLVQVGESMHSISQLYAMKVKSIYQKNKKDYDYVPVEGDVLKLR